MLQILDFFEAPLRSKNSANRDSFHIVYRSNLFTVDKEQLSLEVIVVGTGLLRLKDVSG